MCIAVEILDSEEYEVELVDAGLLDRAVNAILELSNTSTSSCIYHSITDSPMTPEAFDSIEVQIQIPIDENNNINSTPQGSTAIEDHSGMNTTLLKKLSNNVIKKLEVIGARCEGLPKELLITLVGVTGQNAIPMSGKSIPSPIIKYVAMVANNIAFISLLTGVLLRSNEANRVIRGENRRRVLASNMLVMLGIALTVAGPMLNVSINTPNVGIYFAPFSCLLTVVAIFT